LSNLERAGGGTSNGAEPAAATPRGAAGKVIIDVDGRDHRPGGLFPLCLLVGATQRLPALWLMSAVEGKPEVAGARSK
jgi:hypothetical protein